MESTGNHLIQKFDQAAYLVRYAWYLHFVMAVVVTVLGTIDPGNRTLEAVFSGISKLGQMLFLLAKTASECRNSSNHALAITTVVFITGHILIAAYIYKCFCVSLLPPDKNTTPNRLIDLIVWYPLWILLGCGMYVVTYVALADAFHTLCATSPFRVLLFRLMPTIATPFLVGMIFVPVFGAILFLLKLTKQTK